MQYHTHSITGIILYADSGKKCIKNRVYDKQIGHLISASLDKYLVKTDIANDEMNLAGLENKFIKLA